MGQLLSWWGTGSYPQKEGEDIITKEGEDIPKKESDFVSVVRKVFGGKPWMSYIASTTRSRGKTSSTSFGLDR